MREQQLITKKDLYTRYSYHCERCGTDYEKILDKYFYFHKNDGSKIKICKKCANELLVCYRSEVCIHNGELYESSAGIATARCSGCSKLMYDDGISPYCPKCGRNMHYCKTCGCIHDTRGVCNKGLHNHYSLLKNEGTTIDRFTITRESKSWNQKGNVKRIPEDSVRGEEIKSMPFQEERMLPQDINDELEAFYENNPVDDFIFSTYYYREPVNIEGTVEYKRYDGLKGFRNKLEEIVTYGDIDISNGKKANKYRNHYFQNISDDGLITWKYIDMYGGIREKKESINKFLADNGLPIDKLSLTKKIYYRLSSDLRHKLLSFNSNERFGSCQQPHNSESYASGAYDAITNGCNCPILLYDNENGDYNVDKPIGRITSRLMYTKDGQMYILIDRLYNDGTLSGSKIKGMIYKLIIEDLKRQGFKIIVTNYSAHDNSTLQYVETLGLKHTDIIKNLYQPLRRTFDVCGEEGECGYYSDGGIEVMCTDVNGLTWTTDYLDKAYLL